MIMYYLATGKEAWSECQSHEDIFTRVSNGERPAISNGDEKTNDYLISPEYTEIMKQCWDQDATKRPRISEVVEQFRQIKKASYANHLFPITDNNTEIESKKDQ